MQELTYHWEGDYLIPDLEPPEVPRIGKYGTMRHKYLRDHHRGIFDGMLLEGSLNAHLEEIDRQANEMMERLTAQMAENEGVTEALKARDQMRTPVMRLAATDLALMFQPPLLLVQAGYHIIDRYIHSDRCFLWRQTLLHEAEDDRVNLFPYLDDMPVRVIEPNDALAPAVLKQRMYIADIKLFQMIAECVHILFFKIELSRVVRQNNLVRSDK